MKGYEESIAEHLKAWSGWVFGGIAAWLNMRKQRAETARLRAQSVDAAIDARIAVTVNPPLMTQSIVTIQQSITAMQAEVSKMSACIDVVAEDIAYLKGKEAGRAEALAPPSLVRMSARARPSK